MPLRLRGRQQPVGAQAGAAGRRVGVKLQAGEVTLLVPPERQDEEQLILERLSRGERTEHYETVRLSKSGQRIDVSLSISPIRDSAGGHTAAALPRSARVLGINA